MFLKAIGLILIFNEIQIKSYQSLNNITPISKNTIFYSGIHHTNK